MWRYQKTKSTACVLSASSAFYIQHDSTRDSIAVRLIAIVVILGAALRYVGHLSAAERQPIDTFRVAKDGNAIFLPIELHGRQHPFLVDTGSAVTCIDTSLKQILGRPTYSLPIYTTMDRRPSNLQLFRAPQLRLGSRYLSGVENVLCINFQERDFIIDGLPPHGILGMDALGKLVVRVDFSRGELAILPQLPLSRGAAVPLVLDRGVPAVDVRISGLSGKRFVVDTGAIWITSGNIESGLCDLLLASGRSWPVGKSRQTTIFNTTVVRDTRVGGLSLAGFEHQDLLFSEGAINVLSLHYLSRFVIIFDFPNMKMYLEPGERYNDPDRGNASGMDVRQIKRQFYVRKVRDATPAKAAGIQVGDEIVAVNSSPSHTLSKVDLYRLVSTPPGPLLAIRRGDVALSVKLDLGTPQMGQDMGTGPIVPRANPCR